MMENIKNELNEIIDVIHNMRRVRGVLWDNPDINLINEKLIIETNGGIIEITSKKDGHKWLIIIKHEDKVISIYYDFARAEIKGLHYMDKTNKIDEIYTKDIDFCFMVDFLQKIYKIICYKTERKKVFEKIEEFIFSSLSEGHI